MGPHPLRRGTRLRSRVGARFADDLVGLLRRDGVGGAGHQAHQDRHRRVDSRHAPRSGHRTFDRDHQRDRARTHLPRHRHRAHRDARDGPASDAHQGVPRVPARRAHLAQGRAGRIHLRRTHARDSVPPSGPPLPRSRTSDSDLCRRQRPQGLRDRRGVRRRLGHRGRQSRRRQSPARDDRGRCAQGRTQACPIPSSPRR